MTAELQAWLDARAGAMAALLEALVRVPTENPPGRELERCAQVLLAAMDELGLAPELIEDPVIVRGGAGGGEQLVYFHGHFDFVPAHHWSRRTIWGLLRGRRSSLSHPMMRYRRWLICQLPSASMMCTSMFGRGWRCPRRS